MSPGAKDSAVGRRRIEVIAHRGFSGAAPENTLAAIEAAIACGADVVEFDVLLTRDGVPVVIHDPDLDRTTNGRGPVAACSFEEIRRLDAGGWFAPGFSGERIPSLDEVLTACRGRIRVNLEIKGEAVRAGAGGGRGCPPEDDPGGIEEKVLEAVLRLSMDGSTSISSFDPRALGRAARRAPWVARESLYDAALPANRAGVPNDGRGPEGSSTGGRGPAAVCGEVGARAFSCSVEELRTEWIVEAHRAGLALKVYTVDDPAAMESLVRKGIDGIFTNHPDRLLALLGRNPP